MTFVVIDLPHSFDATQGLSESDVGASSCFDAIDELRTVEPKKVLQRSRADGLQVILIGRLRHHAKDDGRFEPLDLPIPTTLVDTTDGYDPAYEEIRDFAA